MDFTNKVVIVTGASSGIGAAIAIAFSAAGAKVAIVGRNETKLASVSARCSDSLVIRADITKDEGARAVIDETIKKFGKLDILVNNAGHTILAGILQGDDTMMKSYDGVMNVNVRAVVQLTTLAAPHLLKTKGNIVNISSIAGELTPLHPGGINYGVSKAAVTHFGVCAAAELATHGVRVNTVSPGPVKTNILENGHVPTTWDKFKKFTILNRVSEPEEIADLVLFLASDKAKGITGSNFISDNGAVIKRGACFSAAGAKVAIVGRNETKLASVSARCSNPLVIRADITKDEGAPAVIDKTIKKFGKLDILINNAGHTIIAGILQGVDTMMKSYDGIMNVNVRAVVQLTTLAAPHLLKTKGNIVNISSIAGELTPAYPGGINYCVSKAAVTHFGACAAAELAPHGVRVNTVSPGPARTDFIENGQVPTTWEKFKKFTSLNRVSEPEEIADLVLFLASDKAKGITGSNFISDNGAVIKRN